jgi:hypothetical protein
MALRVSGVSVSGTSSLVTTTIAGIESTDAESRCPAICGKELCKKTTYMPRVVEATVAIPEPSTVSNSDRVIRSR